MHKRELPSSRVLVRPAYALSLLPCLHEEWEHGSSFDYRPTPVEFPRLTSECRGQLNFLPTRGGFQMVPVCGAPDSEASRPKCDSEPPRTQDAMRKR
jgi:hypothetical protein